MPFPLFSAVLEARVRQLQAERQAERTSKVRAKKAPMTDRDPQDFSGRWAQKLEAERQVTRKRQEEFLDLQQKQTQQSLPLRKEPRIWSKKLASCLQHSKKGVQESSEEEQLAQALQATLPKLSSRSPARMKADVEPQTLVFQQKLLTFFECSVCTGHLPLAHHVLVTHHSRQEKQRLLTLDMYNTVMLGWARKVRPG